MKQTLEELLNQHHHNLTENDHMLAAYIRAHRSACRTISIEELSDQVHLSRAAISRFAQKLGLRGFAELKLYLGLEEENPDRRRAGVDGFVEFCHELTDQMQKQDFAYVCRCIRKAKHIGVFFTGMMQKNVAYEMRRLFEMEQKYFYVFGSEEEARLFPRLLSPEDLLIVISLSGESEYGLNVARRVKLAGIPVISMTSRRENALASLSDGQLYVETTDIMGGDVSFQSSIGFFLLMEMLFIEYQELKKGGWER